MSQWFESCLKSNSFLLDPNNLVDISLKNLKKIIQISRITSQVSSSFLISNHSEIFLPKSITSLLFLRRNISAFNFILPISRNWSSVDSIPKSWWNLLLTGNWVILHPIIHFFSFALSLLFLFLCLFDKRVVQ